MSFDLKNEPLEDAVRRAGELFVEIYRGLEERDVAPNVSREAMADKFRATLENDGIGVLATLEEFAASVLPHSMGTASPLYMGLVNSSPLPAAALGDMLVSAMNNNGGGFEQAPPAYACEDEVVRSFAELFGYGDDSAGLLVPGGSFAILHGLLLARAQHFPDWNTTGPAALEGRPVLYTSEAGHFSVLRAAQVIGIGSDGVASIPTTGRGGLDVDVLAARVEADRQAGRIPFCVAATAGTTGTGAIDPLQEIADFCQAQRLWLHVDACYGGAAVLVDELRPRFAGIERADSISVDPHKWFFIPMVTGLALTRHPEVETAAFDVTPSYIPRMGHVDRYRRGFPASRRSSGLTVWMGLRAHGWKSVRDAAARNIELSRVFESKLRDAGFEVLPDGELSVICARYTPDGMDGGAVDEFQADIAAEVVKTGKAWFATVQHGGKTWLRFNIVNLHTREKHVDAMVTLLQEAIERL